MHGEAARENVVNILNTWLIEREILSNFTGFYAFHALVALVLGFVVVVVVCR